MKWLFPCLFLASCSYNLGIEYTVTYAGYREAVEQVIVAWEEDPTLPRVGAKCDISNLYVAFPNDEQFTYHSSYCPPNACETCTTLCAAAYFLVDSRAGKKRDQYYLVLAAALTEEERTAAVQHEAIHWLSSCTNHENTVVDGWYPYRNADSFHRDVRLWDGVLSRLGL